MKSSKLYQPLLIGLALSLLFAVNHSDAQGRRGNGVWVSGPYQYGNAAQSNFIDLDGDGVCDIANGQISSEPLTDAEAAALIYMREEEKLARDVYLAMYELWSNPVFSRIAVSEQRHMDALKNVLDAQGFPDPVLDTGLFSNADLQTLFDTLIAQGSTSALDALKVGASIEEIEIADLVVAIDETANVYLQQVYTNLLSGSHNHLRAFVRQIEFLGETYTPQVLSQEAVDEILATSSRGNGHNGNGVTVIGNSNRGNRSGNRGNGNSGSGNCGQYNANFVDENNDGICDLTGTPIGGNGNFVDEDGDGINDFSPLAALDLTGEQIASIVELRAAGPGPHYEELASILTDEQIAQLQALKAQRQATRPGMGANQGRGRRNR